MTEPDEEIEGVEQAIGMRLKPRRRIAEAFGMVYTPLGNRYPKLGENIREQIYIGLVENHGWRAIAIIALMAIGIYLAYRSWPFLLVVLFLIPLLALMGYLGARWILRKDKRQFIDLQFEGSGVPVSVKVNEERNGLETVMLESKVTGAHVYTIYEQAISDTPKAGSLQLLGHHEVRDYINNKQIYFTSYISDDGYFAMDNPYPDYGPIALLRSYQDPKIKVARPFQRILDDLERNNPKIPLEDAGQIKAAMEDIEKHLDAIREKGKDISTLLRRLGKNIIKLGDIDFKVGEYLALLDYKNAPMFKEYLDARRIPEHLRMIHLKEAYTKLSSMSYLAQTIEKAQGTAFDKIRIEHYNAKNAITTETAAELARQYFSGITQSGAQPPVAVEKKNFEVVREIENDEDD